MPRRRRSHLPGGGREGYVGQGAGNGVPRRQGWTVKPGVLHFQDLAYPDQESTIWLQLMNSMSNGDAPCVSTHLYFLRDSDPLSLA